MSSRDQRGATEKERLRIEMIERLRSISADRAMEDSLSVCDALRGMLEELAPDGVVMSFSAIRRSGVHDEVDLSALHHYLLETGRLALPRLDWETRSMEALLLPSAPVLDEATMLEVRRHGVPEPARGEAVAPAALRAILIPGLAFDARGGRLGRGGGFYDRFLQRLEGNARPVLIGVCFGVQVVERVPMEPHDRRVDRVVTESSRMVCDR